MSKLVPQEMAKPLTILLAPINLVGPINAFTGMAQVLKEAGHRIVFAIKSDWKGKLAVHGFEEEIIGAEDESFAGKGSAERNVQNFSDMFGPEPRLDKLKRAYDRFGESELSEHMEEDQQIEEVVRRVKPDVIITEQIVCLPSIMNETIPWVNVMTCNPLTFGLFYDTGLPTSGLGLPVDGDPEEWRRLKQFLEEGSHEYWIKWNDWVVSKGLQPLPRDKRIGLSPFLNIYMCPQELDYTDIKPWPSNFVRFDNFKRSAKLDSFEIPDKLKGKPGSLVFLSMGSMASGNVPLMKRLVAILSKSKHRFIVSKGAFGDQYELADNMWGDKYVPQLQILQVVDLVITHGGNNSVTETLYYGKPIIAMPMFFDQFDNAQRLHEKGLGIELNPFECTETELIGAIDNILNDTALVDKVDRIGQRIRSEQNILKLPQIIEHLVENHKKNDR